MLNKILKFINIKRAVKEYRILKQVQRRVDLLENNIENKWLLERVNKNIAAKELIKLHEFKIYSQNGEDGLIDYIFSKIKTTNKNFIEIGVEDGRECNTAVLSLHLGWKGVLIDGDENYVRKAQEYYKNKRVSVIHSFITRENINEVIKKCGVEGELDLFSLDIDGNDYWVLEELKIKPRVIIVEYNSSFGPKRSISTIYDPKFNRFEKHKSGMYYGASLSAFTKLAKKKGYVLVGCTGGVNAFFVRNDVAKGKIKELGVEEAFEENDGPLERYGNYEKQFKKIKNLRYVKV